MKPWNRPTHAHFRNIEFKKKFLHIDQMTRTPYYIDRQARGSNPSTESPILTPEPPPGPSLTCVAYIAGGSATTERRNRRNEEIS